MLRQQRKNGRKCHQVDCAGSKLAILVGECLVWIIAMRNRFQLQCVPQLAGLLVLSMLCACSSTKTNVVLAPAKKAELERLFFNQMVSIHYGTSYSNPFAEKKAYLRALADQGLEIADIAIQITTSTGGNPRAEAPYRRLHELVMQGDVGAKCFYQVHPSNFDGFPEGQDPLAQIQAWRFIQEGAAAGHPACKAELAWYLFDGDTSLGKDIGKARQFAIEAGDAGYLKGYWTLSHFNWAMSKEIDEDGEKSLCWEAKALALKVPWYSRERYQNLSEVIEFRRLDGRLLPKKKSLDNNCQ